MDNKILRKVQLAQVIALDEIVRICDTHGLRYYLAGGSMLGAVRHGGFIPWDDDLDISMPRDDYERFAEICESELGEEFELQSVEKEPNYNLFLAKVRIKNTRLVDRVTANLDINQGIYVDIFPLDNCDGIDKALIKRAKRFGTLAKIKAVKLGIARKTGFIKNLSIFAVRLFAGFMSIDSLNKKVYKTMTCHKGGDMYINFCSQYGYKRQTMPKQWFGNGTPYMFEGKEYMLPSEYDKVLINIYKDYMKLPPKEKQKTVHDFIEVDLGGCEEMIKERFGNEAI